MKAVQYIHTSGIVHRGVYSAFELSVIPFSLLGVPKQLLVYN